jgi:uncharacterized membrane protein SpoIIM required for sporulation
MTESGVARSGPATRVGNSARQWAPYVGLAAAVFVASTAWGFAVGASQPSAFVPGSADGTAGFLSLVSVAAVMVVGGVFVGLPTVALLGLEGSKFGGSLAGLVAVRGSADAITLAAPAAVLAVPALVVVAAIPLRGLHYAARMIREDSAPAVPTERLVGEAVSILVAAVLALYLATTLAA